MALFEVASTTGFLMACMLRGLLLREGNLLRLAGGSEVSTNLAEVQCCYESTPICKDRRIEKNIVARIGDKHLAVYKFVEPYT